MLPQLLAFEVFALFLRYWSVSSCCASHHEYQEFFHIV